MADIRALMKQKAAGKRISHPYAKYGNSGQLSCSLCGVPVKSDVLWPSHLSSKVHRNSVRKEKEQLEQQQEQEQSDVANLRKRAASDPPDALDENGQQDKMSSKRVRFDESLDEANVPTSLPSADIDANPSTSSSFLPAGFFDDPSQVPQINGNEARDYEDEEWAAFEATLAAEADSAEQQQNTSSVPFSAHATFSAQEVLYDNDNDETPNGDAANGQAGDIEEEDNDEPKETEQKRKEREDREELMQRIEIEEREQQEADERVDALKRRLLSVRTARQSTKTTKANGNDVQELNTDDAPAGPSTARQRRRRGLRG